MMIVVVLCRDLLSTPLGFVDHDLGLLVVVEGHHGQGVHLLDLVVVRAPDEVQSLGLG